MDPMMTSSMDVVKNCNIILQLLLEVIHKDFHQKRTRYGIRVKNSSKMKPQYVIWCFKQRLSLLSKLLPSLDPQGCSRQQ